VIVPLKLLCPCRSQGTPSFRAGIPRDESPSRKEPSKLSVADRSFLEERPHSINASLLTGLRRLFLPLGRAAESVTTDI